MGSVMVGICAPQKVETLFAKSLFQLALWDRTHGSQHLANPPAVWMTGGSLLPRERNMVVQHFLESDAEWLWLIDTDQTFPPHLLERMMAQADPVDRPIVAAPVWVWEHHDDGDVGVGVNVYDVVEGGGFVKRAEVPSGENVVEQVAAVGSGCLLIHRDALRRMQVTSVEGGGSANWGWFWLWWSPPDHTEGEDLWFCRLAARCGLPIFVDWLHVLGHVKPVVLHGSMSCDGIRIVPAANE